MRSLLRNKDELEELIIREKKQHILALTETRITDQITDEELNIKGYNMVNCFADKRSTGGVSVYIKCDIKFKVIVNKKIVNNCWCVGIKIMNNNFNGIILVTYHSPSMSDSTFIDFIDEICDTVMNDKICLCIGDFNIDVNKKHSMQTN